MGGSFGAALRRLGWHVDEVGRTGPFAPPAVEVDLVLLCTPDDVVSEVAAAIEPADAVVAHVAGSLPLDVLEPHRRRAGIHPLMSLPNAEVEVHESASEEARLEQVRRAIGLGTEHQWVETTPSALKHPEYIEARAEYERLVGSRDVWRKQIAAVSELDITDLAPPVRAGTLTTFNDNSVPCSM